MINHNDLKKLASTRLKEARLLHSKGLYDGAAYLCFYVIELALKARVCKHLKITEYPDEGDFRSVFLSHNFDRLILLAGLQNKVTAAEPRFTNWNLLTQNLNSEKRYEPIGTNDKNFVDSLFVALCDKRLGIYTWLKKIW